MQVQRHGLPAARVLWSTPGADQTVAELLQQINDLIPIETEDWGLEDYEVHVGGYEALHYFRLSDVLKDEDEVMQVIRWLYT